MASPTELRVFIDGRKKEYPILSFPFIFSVSSQLLGDQARGLRFSPKWLPRHEHFSDIEQNRECGANIETILVKDFSRLERGEWLNDAIINVCFNW